MGKLRITQIRSGIDRPARQKANLKALGITRNGQSVEKESTPQIMGMLRQVHHLVKVENI